MFKKNELLSLSDAWASKRNAIQEQRRDLILVSLDELINECGGQEQAAAVIRNFYGYPCVQGTISKARKGSNAMKIRSQLRFAINTIKEPQSVQAQTKMINHFGRLPVHHDFVRVDGELGLFLGFGLLSRTLQIQVFVGGEFKTVSANDVELI
ncbi:TPA: hypothetical protein ACPJ0Q_004558 [Vibrio diabolicus]|uniref:hypothetical protein n=1 Tax=Vibrio harveyi group TaxID=717610 RepID=UPI00045294B6|nr:MULTISPECIES: hypothetical protein [Vibrio harveyi group]EIA1624670.1 hypothetical protein [Vibrio parahaemolyticus]EIV8635991.1 hypothetical protein [Vibrio parahaemolyticus]EIZ1449495.1 hypothetical protein [Vibrio parahaemolyticus]EJF4459603.1 hypothetical protein [Vibrio parahaemolyticus]EKB1972488.1 hypothetical protein [Vibrio parahaemolyticus]